MATTLLGWLISLLSGGTQAGAGVSPFAAGRGPARVLVMRHGEKTGDRRDPHLSVEGQARAEELIDYIPSKFGKPDYLFAATSSKRSSRPYETLEPLASKLGLPINEDYDDEDFDELVDALRAPEYANAFVVVAWRHSDIPSLCAALGAPSGTCPEAWDDSVFNVVIDITYPRNAAPTAVSITEPF